MFFAAISIFVLCAFGMGGSLLGFLVGILFGAEQFKKFFSTSMLTCGVVAFFAFIVVLITGGNI